MEASTGGARSSVTRSDVARIFGSALALRADDATLVWFDNRSGQVPVPAGTSLLTLSKAFPRAGGGTATEAAVRQWYAGHDRVVIVTDEQAHWGGGADVTEPVPAEVPVYTWNLGGYRYGHAPSGRGTRHTFGGLTDAAFQAIPLLERDGAASWPWAPGHAHGAPRGEQSDEPSCDPTTPCSAGRPRGL
jgi:hypothetical protein